MTLVLELYFLYSGVTNIFAMLIKNKYIFYGLSTEQFAHETEFSAYQNSFQKRIRSTDSMEIRKYQCQR